MRNRSLSCMIVLLAFVLGAQAPLAEEHSAKREDPLVAQIAEVNRSLDRLARLLAEGLAHQRIDVMLKRIELKERRLAPLEGQLRGTRVSLMNVRSELRRLNQMKESAEQELSEQTLAGNEPAMNESRYMIGSIEQEILGLQSKLEDLEQQVVQLENDLADGRDEIEILDEMLAELLE